MSSPRLFIVSAARLVRRTILDCSIAIVAMGCGSSTITAVDAATGCPHGQVAACSCEGGAQGTQSCLTMGGYTACACPCTDAGTDAPSIAPDVQSTDASMDVPQLVDVARVTDLGVDVAPSPTDVSDACGANLQSDPMNCGSCGNACSTGNACTYGACVLVCGGVPCSPRSGCCIPSGPVAGCGCVTGPICVPW